MLTLSRGEGKAGEDETLQDCKILSPMQKEVLFNKARIYPFLLP